MTTAPSGGLGRHGGLTLALLVLALVVIAVESSLLYRSFASGKAGPAQSRRQLSAFLLADSAQASAGESVSIRLQNVRFKWSDRVYIDAGELAVRAVPLRGTTVDFDDLASFHLVVQQSVVLIWPDVMAGMFNESIFNYPGSRVRSLKVAIVRDDKGVLSVVLSGRMHLLAWIPFTMYTHLGVDTTTNTLVIEVDHLKVFGVIPATKLIRWTPLHLDRLIALPPNKSLLVDNNRIMVRPFAMFPPPRIDGRLASVMVGDSAISVTFAGDAIPAPKAAARNYVYLRGGNSQFGHFLMADTDLLILDQDPANPFVVSLLHYAELLPRSRVEARDTRSLRIMMPDF